MKLEQCRSDLKRKLSIEGGSRIRVEQSVGKSKSSEVIHISTLRSGSDRISAEKKWYKSNMAIGFALSVPVFAIGLYSLITGSAFTSDDKFGESIIMIAIAPVFFGLLIMEIVKAKRYAGDKYVFYDEMSGQARLWLFCENPSEKDADEFRDTLEGLVLEFKTDEATYCEEDDLAAELNNLAALVKAGALSEKEFAQAKHSLLGS
ncbi:MAG: hypothetical protein MI807_14445 [Verrucomicrobiales bacterium]|nr:hypothetical protein [Verrucomicrobiales bacterium]